MNIRACHKALEDYAKSLDTPEKAKKALIECGALDEHGEVWTQKTIEKKRKGYLGMNDGL